VEKTIKLLLLHMYSDIWEYFWFQSRLLYKMSVIRQKVIITKLFTLDYIINSMVYAF